MEGLPSKAWSSETLNAALGILDGQLCKEEASEEQLAQQIQD